MTGRGGGTDAHSTTRERNPFFDGLQKEGLDGRSWESVGSYRVGNASRGMHLVLDIDMRLETAACQTALVDVLALFRVPDALFVDLYHLEGRHDFGWADVVLHVDRRDVDSESVAKDQGTDILIGVEFLALPVMENQHCEARQDMQVEGARTCPSASRLSHSFSLPLTMYYQQPRNCSEGGLMAPSTFAAVHIPRLDLFTRPSSSPISSQPHVCYEISRLGGDGNYDECLTSHLYSPVHAETGAAPVVYAAIGCAENRHIVRSVSLSVVHFTFICLFFIIGCRAR
ncbi:hypothetical protein B484DRAFT_446022 [Ochromonadaceae sp. CCMP2298]|nr:hypothetical protein B484DRAFT_446022 [Ochromonadaceae sp. CCMP2298]|mmetsp:Transcript_21819/g.48533  ORF Transcript_21819/g.48533 Transcript_21819/m.48533 type:complete len:285 (-) Transcript_21819:30-884(-)